MQNAIEFVTEKKKGGIIQIPKKYINDVAGEFRVILILNPETPKKNARKKEFKALKIKTKGFKFDRDEIYDDE